MAKQKKTQDKMTAQVAAKIEYLERLAKLQSEGLAKTLNELNDTLEACGCAKKFLTPMRKFCKSLMDVSQSFCG